MLTVDGFRSTFNIEYQTYINQRWRGLIPERLFKIQGGVEYIDESYFVKRDAFIKKVHQEAQDFYWFFRRKLPSSHLAEAMSIIDGEQSSIGTWNAFFHKDLFAYKEGNIVTQKIQPLLWRFFRYSRWLLMGMFRIIGRRFEGKDINKVYDIDEK